MTNQQAAEKIVAMFAALGFPAHVDRACQDVESVMHVVVGPAGQSVPVFEVASNGVQALAVRLLIGGLSARPASRPKWKDIEARCERIVDLMRDDTEKREQIKAAKAVADELKALGLPAVVVSGRVSITLDFSPEYAREMGPKLLAMLGERKAAPAWREMHEHRGEFYSGPRIRVIALPPQQGREKAGKAMRDLRRMGKVNLEQVAIALRISIPDVSSLERGEKTTDDAGWTEIQTALFLLGSGKKPEHVADPRSDPSFLRALESCEEESE